MSDKFIIITSINHPTKAIEQFSAIDGWKVVVVADLKTPANWAQENVKFLTVEEQRSLPFETAKILPWNHYARKNLGYLYAMSQGAQRIYETDDDNLPYDDWPIFYPLELTAGVSRSEETFINAYSHFCNLNIWPRGFPLENLKQGQVGEVLSQNAIAPVQQGLADLDPDVDAIYRLVIGELINFDKCDPLFIAPGTYCPFNSQNTLWYPEAFKYLLLPAFVPSRVTDIWRGYIVQSFLHRANQGVLFCSPSVYQERNFHNLLADFREELQLYTETSRLIEKLAGFTGEFENIAEYLHASTLLGEGDVALLKAWMSDIRTLGLL